MRGICVAGVHICRTRMGMEGCEGATYERLWGWVYAARSMKNAFALRARSGMGT